MMYALKMPDAFAGFGVECDQTICEEIVADAVCAIEIKDCGPCGYVQDAAFDIKRHASPVVRCAGIRPSFFRPRVVAEFAGMRDGVKAPAQGSSSNIESADVAGRRGM